EQVSYGPAAEGAGFEHVGGGDAEVLIGGDRASDKAVQERVVEPLPPGDGGGSRSQVGLTAIAKSSANFGLGRMEIRPGGAAVQEQGRGGPDQQHGQRGARGGGIRQ